VDFQGLVKKLMTSYRRKMRPFHEARTNPERILVFKHHGVEYRACRINDGTIVLLVDGEPVKNKGAMKAARYKMAVLDVEDVHGL
jgi:ribosomal protein L16/L10AE